MKKICFLLILQIIVCTVFAQFRAPVNSQKDKIDFEGYTIKLIPSEGGSYGYDIFKGNSLVVHQSLNPFTMAPIGLDKKEDAYKVAKWQIQQLKTPNGEPKTAMRTATPNNRPLPDIRPMQPIPMGAQYNRPIPQKIAKDLNIQLHQSFTPVN